MIGTIAEAKEQMNRATSHFDSEINKIRTGRANAAILEGVMVTVYGQQMPIQHVANINALDSQMLQVTPYDPNNLDAISSAIRDNKSLGLNPADDGHVVRVPIPTMTEERRVEVVKQVGEKVEEAKISLRNIRHELLKTAKQQEKDSEITKDDYIDTDKKIGELMEEFQTKIEDTAKAKEQEIMTV